MYNKVPTQQTTKQHDPKKCITAFKNNKDLHPLKDVDNAWWCHESEGYFGWDALFVSFLLVGFIFENRSHCVSLPGLELNIHQSHLKFSKICLSLTPPCWDQRHASPCLALLADGWLGQAYNNQIVTRTELISKQEKRCKEIRHVLILTDPWHC